MEAEMDRYLLGSNFRTSESSPGFDSVLNSPAYRDKIMNIHETTMAEHPDGEISRILTEEQILAVNEFPKSI